jgi:hypothetical protein
MICPPGSGDVCQCLAVYPSAVEFSILVITLPVLLPRCLPALIRRFGRAKVLGSLHHYRSTISRKSSTNARYSVIGHVHGNIPRVFKQFASTRPCSSAGKRTRLRIHLADQNSFGYEPPWKLKAVDGGDDYKTKQVGGIVLLLIGRKFPVHRSSPRVR